MKKSRRHLDLRTKISLVLAAVILPTFLIVTFAENQVTKPILEDEIRQVGITSAKTLAAEIVSSRLLALSDPTPAIERRIQELIYSQPNILRLEVIARDPLTGLPKIFGSNIEDEPDSVQIVPLLVDSVSSKYMTNDDSGNFWDIFVPIEQKARVAHGSHKIIGAVHIEISTKLVSQIVNTLWKTTASAAAFSVVTLIVVLGYFLKKTVANDRKLREAETQNLQLTEQLHEVERKLMNTEKLAVMGQLTASFAHEIGTPLNAVGGHMQLLEDELRIGGTTIYNERFSVINGQLLKIETIVKGFLQSTAKPESQRQLVDLNRLLDRTLAILRPRIDLLRVDLKSALEKKMGPVRAVPLEIEQILLNLLNNSLDSMASKRLEKEKARLAIEISTEASEEDGRSWAKIMIFDTGEGIPKEDLGNVLKPFFTTKKPEEGTGLGLTICQQLVHKHGGALNIDSKEGAWTKVTLKLPYTR
ncbi:MAG: hypothetical protein A2X97_13120 [Bdellovibrionales bacterium GWA1_52_35]|nr:MAG: hypothetical protein A2X97_13120 [Bdellovibrionales bacterium GWA1_52_35]HCM39967.1 hypothetical protein [Bdellovibrionales bacterium]